MEYYKQHGVYWNVFYAVDEQRMKVLSIEERLEHNAESDVAETFLITTYNHDAGTYDPIAVHRIKTYDSISNKEWQAAKKRASDYIKNLGAV